MQNIFKLFFVLLFCSLLGCNQPVEVQKNNSTFLVLNYRDAMRTSSKDGKRVVLMFSADWCVPCKKMKQVLRDKDIRKILIKDYHFAIVDSDTERITCEKHHVKSLPTFVMLDSNGKELDRFIGYKTTRSFIRWLEGF